MRRIVNTVCIALAVGVMIVGVIGLRSHPRPVGVQSDGEHVAVHGVLYRIEDDSRSGCWQTPSGVVFFPHIYQVRVLPLGFEVGC